MKRLSRPIKQVNTQSSLEPAWRLVSFSAFSHLCAWCYSIIISFQLNPVKKFTVATCHCCYSTIISSHFSSFQFNSIWSRSSPLLHVIVVILPAFHLMSFHLDPVQKFTVATCHCCSSTIISRHSPLFYFISTRPDQETHRWYMWENENIFFNSTKKRVFRV